MAIPVPGDPQIDKDAEELYRILVRFNSDPKLFDNLRKKPLRELAYQCGLAAANAQRYYGIKIEQGLKSLRRMDPTQT